MNNFRKSILLLLIIGISFAESYRILGVFPFLGKSHDVMYEALMLGLAERNHQVDVITHFPPKNPPANYTVLVDLSGTAKTLINTFTFDYAKSLSGDVLYYLANFYGSNLCHIMKMDKIQKLLKNPPTDPPYDLVITEAFGAQCFFGIGHFLKVPVIGVSSHAETPWLCENIGNTESTAFVPHVFYGSFDKLNFWDRLKNTLSYYWTIYRFNKMTGEIQTELMRKYLSPDMPDIREVERNVELMLVNRHPVINGPKPLTSAMIEVGGLHIRKDLKLPEELQKWLDDSVDGVVYFTFGSMVLIETLPVETIKDIYKSFSKLQPMRVLMKIADKKKLPPGLPKNVKISPWIPQQAVLAHKNIRVFITHGGLMGTQEALYFGIPLIGIPLFGDQPVNIALYEKMGMAIRMDFNNITETSLNEALNSALNDPKYRKSAQHYSRLFRDRPMDAMDTAAFWVEYVIRNGGSALKSPALELSSWQTALLDVYAFIFLCFALFVYFVYYSTKFIIHACFSRSSKKLKKS